MKATEIQGNTELYSTMIACASSYYEVPEGGTVMTCHVEGLIDELSKEGYRKSSDIAEEKELLVAFARLWGEYEALNLTTKDEMISIMLKEYDSMEMQDVLCQWVKEYLHNEEADDVVDFFEKKLEDMYAAEYPKDPRVWCEIQLVDFDENNVPCNGRSVICSSPNGMSKTEAEAFCRDDLGLGFEEVFRISPLTEEEAMDRRDDMTEAELPHCDWAQGPEWARGGGRAKSNLDARIKSAEQRKAEDSRGSGEQERSSTRE